MSKKRTFEEINKEYMQLCGEYGHALHQANMLESFSEKRRAVADKLALKLHYLNQEAERAGIPKGATHVEMPDIAPTGVNDNEVHTDGLQDAQEAVQ